MDMQLLIKEVRKVLAEMPEISLVYLFGSQLTGNTGPLSDVDIGILVDRTADEIEVSMRFAHSLTSAFPSERFDVIPLGKSPVELAYAVIASSICIYERNTTTRIEYEAKVLGLYGDYLPVLRKQREDILRGDEYYRRVQRYRAAIRRTERTIDQIRKS